MVIRLSCLAAVLTALLAGSGCEHNVYQLELVPDGDQLKRELTVWRERSSEQGAILTPLPQSQLDAISAAYNTTAGPTAASRYKFSGRFTKLPADIGGAGTYFQGKTPMGALYGYSERVRGNDDLAESVRQRRDAVNRLTDHLIGWLRTELGEHEDFAKLQAFLDEQLRRDFQNFSLYLWTLGIASEYQQDGDLGPDTVARMGQFLVERGYLEPAEIPGVVRAARDASQGNEKRLLARLKQALLSRARGQAGEKDANELFVVAVDRLFADTTTLRQSLHRYLLQTPDYQAMLKRWEAAHLQDPTAKRPLPEDVLSEATGKALLSGINLFGQRDELRVTLRAEVQPFATNGVWKPDSHSLEWSRKIESADQDATGYPPLMFATWSVPDRGYQEARFGRVLLTSDALAEYCVWYLGLDESESRQWDALVAGIDPNRDPASRIESFRFAGEPPPDADGQPESLAAAAQRLLVTALRGG